MTLFFRDFTVLILIHFAAFCNAFSECGKNWILFAKPWETTYNINYKSYHDKNMAGGINIIQEIDASLDMSQ